MATKELDLLLFKISNGDNVSFERFYNLTVKGVFAFAYSYLGNKEDTEDIVQSTYLTVKQKAYTYKKGTNARAWLFQIVKNLALDELRRRKRRQTEWEQEKISDSLQNFENAAEYLLNVLSSEEKEIVILHVFWGYKHREIANLLNIPLGTVTWKYNAAINKLKKYKEEI